MLANTLDRGEVPDAFLTLQLLDLSGDNSWGWEGCFDADLLWSAASTVLEKGAFL